EHHRPGDEDAAHFAEDEGGVGPAAQPPVGRHPRPVPARVELGVTRRLAHRAPRGRKNPLSHSSVAVSLYRWMAAAGATFFGQTLVHSPTNVQPQTPSCVERMSSRSLAPSSRESRLYRWARAIAAGPRNFGSSPYTRHAEQQSMQLMHMPNCLYSSISPPLPRHPPPP